ncbi:YbaB/EbfC family nucleoid-associated protein [Amycolatopsis lurida]
MAYQSSTDLLEEMRWRLGQIRDRQARNEELRATLEQTGAQLSALEATATSPDGTVTVIAGSGGIVRSVHLSDSAMRANAAALSATITSTIEAAIGQATTKQLEIVQARLGDEVDPGQILGPQAKFASYGTPAPAPAVVAPHPDDEEPFGSVLTNADDSGPPAPASPYEEEPASDSERFLRNLGWDR